MRRWETLEVMAKKHHWQRGAEIGLWYGATFFYLLDHVPGLHMIGVDCWKENTLQLPSHQDQEENRTIVLSRSSAPHYFDRCRILDMPSMTAIRYVPDASLDFVFIDADHSYEEVCNDIREWSFKVRPGGYITGHDYDWPSVKRAVDELLPGAVVEESDFVWSIQK